MSEHWCQIGDHFRALRSGEIDGGPATVGGLSGAAEAERLGHDTRPRRGNRTGRDYHFLSHDEFQRRRENGEFLECKEVFGRGDWYGTLRSEVTTGHAEGKWVLLEIDVAGALTVLQQIPDAITIFIHPGSMAELETAACVTAARRRPNRWRDGWKWLDRKWPASTSTNTR